MNLAVCLGAPFHTSSVNSLPLPQSNNESPIADAGSDQTVTDTDNSGSEFVLFDGSGSSDIDGTIVSYSWTENGVEIATIIQPTVTLSVGIHTITLTVTDDDGETDSDDVVITVNPPPTSTSTNTPTVTDTATNTPTETATYTPSPTETPTATDTPTETPTNTVTYTPSPTETPTPTYTPTNTLTPTSTPTPGSTTGLLGYYYDNIDLTNRKLGRTDAVVDFDWGSGSPDASVGADTFSVRWTGQVVPQYSETYTFYTQSDDGVRLWVNGTQIINNWTDHASTEDSGTIALTAGTRYDVRLDYYDNATGAIARLSWSSASQSKQVIPTDRLIPNGRIAFVSNRDGDDEIYTIRSDGTDLQQLTFNNSLDLDPTWSPDGNNIAFASNINGPGDIYIMGKDGSNLANLTMTPDETEMMPSWSPDGSQIAFSRYTANGADIYIINADGTGIIRIVDGGDTTYNLFPTWSPDGSQIAFVSTDELLTGGQQGAFIQLNILDISSGNQSDLVFLDVYGNPDWSWSNNHIAYYDLSNYYTAIKIVRVNTGEYIALPNETFPNQELPYPRADENPSWSPDGEFIVFDSKVYSDTDPNYSDRDIYVMNSEGTNITNLTPNTLSNDVQPAWQPVIFNEPTPTSTSTETATATTTFTPTPTDTPTETPTFTATSTETLTNTPTNTATSTPTLTLTPSSTPTNLCGNCPWFARYTCTVAIITF